MGASDLMTPLDTRLLIQKGHNRGTTLALFAARVDSTTMSPPYPMALRTQVREAFAARHDAAAVAGQFGVSRSWVYRLAQRERATGTLAPTSRPRVLAPYDADLRHAVECWPQTLTALQAALPRRAALSTIARELRRMGYWRLLGLLLPPRT